MSNPDRRVPFSAQPGRGEDDFFVDITPAEFSDRKRGQRPVPEAAPEPVLPNVPGQASFVERRATPVRSEESGGFYFRTPKMQPAQKNGKVETEVNPSSTDEMLTLPDPPPSPNGKSRPEDHNELTPEHTQPDLSETVTEDIPNPLAAAATTKAAAAKSPEQNGDPTLADKLRDQPTNEQLTSDNDPEISPDADGQTAEVTGEAAGQNSEIVQDADKKNSEAAKQEQETNSGSELSPAQIQLAEVRAMLAKMSRPTQQGEPESAELSTSEHPIGDELQAKLESADTAVAEDPIRDMSTPPEPAPAETSPAAPEAQAHAEAPEPTPVTPSSPPIQQSDSESLEVTGEYAAITVEVAAEDLSDSSVRAIDRNRDGFFDGDGSGAESDRSRSNDGLKIDSSQSDVSEAKPQVNDNTVDPDDGADPTERRRPKRPIDRRREYEVVNHGQGNYDYDHEYYSAAQSKMAHREPSPDTVNANNPKAETLSSHSTSNAGTRRPEALPGNRASDMVDRLRLGRLILLFCIVAMIGGVWWAVSSGRVDVADLRERFTPAPTDSAETSTSDTLTDDAVSTTIGSTPTESETDSSTVGETDTNSDETNPIEGPDTPAEGEPVVQISLLALTAGGDALAGVPIEIATANGSTVLSELETSVDGSAEYYSEVAGCYQIRIATLPGWVLAAPKSGTFASVCGHQSLSPSLSAVFRESKTKAPSSCEIQRIGSSEPQLTVSEPDGNFADFYTAYDEIGQKLAETEVLTEGHGQQEQQLKWPTNATIDSEKISTLSGTANGEESPTTSCLQPSL